MSDELSPEAIKAARERRLEEARQAAADAFDRDMAKIAEARRLAAQYPELFASVVSPAPAPGAAAATAPEAAAPQPQQNALTLATLIDRYRTDEGSPFHQVRFRTRENYESLLKRLRRDHGDVRMRDLTADDVHRFHDSWSHGGTKAVIAHSLITMFRTLVSFGVDVLKDPDCQQLSYFLHRMRFPVPKRDRGGRLNREQVAAIIEAANAMGLSSISLAQAFQYDCKLRQGDVIGEWVPVEEPGMSEVTWDEFGKWLRGIRWNQIDENFVLRHVTSKEGEEIVRDLIDAPAVIREFRRRYCALGEPLTRDKLPASGPIILSEKNGKPYLTHSFRRLWRKAANAAGVPKNVFNMDSAGADDEASEPRAVVARS